MQHAYICKIYSCRHTVLRQNQAGTPPLKSGYNALGARPLADEFGILHERSAVSGLTGHLLQDLAVLILQPCPVAQLRKHEIVGVYEIDAVVRTVPVRNNGYPVKEYCAVTAV